MEPVVRDWSLYSTGFHKIECPSKLQTRLLKRVTRPLVRGEFHFGDLAQETIGFKNSTANHANDDLSNPKFHIANKVGIKKPSRVQIPNLQAWVNEPIGFWNARCFQDLRSKWWCPTLDPMVARDAWIAFRRPDWPPNKMTVGGKLSLDCMIVLLWGLCLPEWYTALPRPSKKLNKSQTGQHIVKPELYEKLKEIKNIVSLSSKTKYPESAITCSVCL